MVNPLARPGTSVRVLLLRCAAGRLGDIFFHCAARFCSEISAGAEERRSPTAVGSRCPHAETTGSRRRFGVLQFGPGLIGARPAGRHHGAIEFGAARLADRVRTAEAVLAGDPADDLGLAHQCCQGVGRGGAAILTGPIALARRSCRAAAARRPASGRHGRAAAAFLRQPRQPGPAGRSAPPAGGTGAASRWGSTASDTPAAAITPATSRTTNPFASSRGNPERKIRRGRLIDKAARSQSATARRRAAAPPRPPRSTRARFPARRRYARPGQARARPATACHPPAPARPAS